MFGVLDGGCHMRRADKAAWWEHICGLCLALRDEHSQVARLTTNYDAALLSVLFEAQAPHLAQRTTNVCALRSFRRAGVVETTSPGTRYAAAISLNMAATKLIDHAADGEGWTRLVPGNQWLASRWRSRSAAAAQKMAFDPAAIDTEVAMQPAVERNVSDDILSYSRPTERAVGAAFRHTAVLAQMPANADPLDLVGQMYGRIMYFLDSYRDYAGDLRAGKFNALAHHYSVGDLPQAARTLLQEAHGQLTRAFNQLVLPRPDLARSLLIRGLLHTTLHTLDGAAMCMSREPKKRRSWTDWCDCSGCDCSCCECCRCCECLECCGDSNCDCGGCDCSCDC